MAIERESVGQMEVIRFETPELGSLPKVSSHIAQSDILSVVIQVVSKEGGETNLHAHSGQDAVWFVLAGRAKFYGKDERSWNWAPRTHCSYRAYRTGLNRRWRLRNAATDFNYEGCASQQDGRHEDSVYELVATWQGGAIRPIPTRFPNRGTNR